MTKLIETYTGDEWICPHCRSDKIQAKERGINFASLMVLGAIGLFLIFIAGEIEILVVFGIICLVAALITGVRNSRQIIYTCLNCGNRYGRK